MAKTTGLTSEQLQVKIDELKASGKTESTSKELGKYVNAYMALNPTKYGSDAVANAKAKLSTSTQVPGSVAGASTGGNAGVSSANGTPDLNALYNQYFNTSDITTKKAEADKVAASRDAAITSVQNNPWFSQGTRGGKIAGITSDSERNLMRVNNELATLQDKATTQYNMQLQQYNLNRQALQDAIANNAVTLQSYDDGNGQYILAVDKQGRVVNREYVGASKSTGASTVDLEKYLSLIRGDVSGAATNKVAYTPPQTSGKPGAVVEYPAGTGVYWTAGSDGSWN